MSPRKIKLLLNVSIAILLTGAFLVIGWSVWMPCVVTDQELEDWQGLDSPPSIETKDERAEVLALAAFEELCQIPLRRPLYDPPPPKPAAAPVRKPPPPPVVLVGTIIEPGRSMAIVRANNGQLELKGVGDTVGPAGSQTLVEQVDPDQLVLRHHEQLIAIPMKPGPNGKR